jgi:hypothetical protein
MSATAQPYVRLGFSYGLALLTGFFQATFCGMTGLGEIHKVAGPVAAISFAAWLISVFWTFAASMKLGWLSLFGAIPALTFLWIVAMLLWACASGRGCI